MIGTVAEAGDAKMNKIWFLPSKSSYPSKGGKYNVIKTVLNYSWQCGRKLESGPGPLKMNGVSPGKQEWEGTMFRRDVRIYGR